APCAVDIISAAVTAPARTAIFMRSPLRDPGASPAGKAPPAQSLKIKCGINVESGDPGTKPALRACREVSINHGSGAFRGPRPFAGGRAGYSSFAPESLTRAAHFGASIAMKAAKSCGDPIFACALNRAKFVLISGDCRASLMAALSLPTIGAGVPAGPSTPVQEADGNPLYPLSSMVGTSGRAGMRCGLMTAKGLTLPD